MSVTTEDQRALRAQWFGGLLFVALTALLIGATSWNQPFSWTNALLAVGCYAVAGRVSFPVANFWTDPTQIVFVPMLFLLPAAVVPLAVAAGFLVSNAGHRIRRPIDAVVALNDSLYCLAPAAIFAFTSAGAPRLGDWWIYTVAVLGQILLNTGAYAGFEWMARGVVAPWRGLLLNWSHLVDVCLSLVGMLVAVAVTGHSPYVIVLVVPLFALFALFAQDRHGRIEAATELSSAYRGTAMLLGDVVEADHAYTGSHSKEVVDLSLAVAERMNLDDEARRMVEFGALLHDVGKIAVPKEIIDKAGPLDNAEWEIMKRHTIEGQRLLDRVGGALGKVGTVVRASHEHYNGRGYPDGLWGEQIPIEARIITCCDAYSAMTTDRSYRRAMSRANAIAELKREAGQQFDPLVVRLLVDVLDAQPAPEGNHLETSPTVLILS